MARRHLPASLTVWSLESTWQDNTGSRSTHVQVHKQVNGKSCLKKKAQLQSMNQIRSAVYKTHHMVCILQCATVHLLTHLWLVVCLEIRSHFVSQAGWAWNWQAPSASGSQSAGITTGPTSLNFLLPLASLQAVKTAGDHQPKLPAINNTGEDEDTRLDRAVFWSYHHIQVATNS